MDFLISIIVTRMVITLLLFPPISSYTQEEILTLLPLATSDLETDPAFLQIRQDCIEQLRSTFCQKESSFESPTEIPRTNIFKKLLELHEIKISKACLGGAYYERVNDILYLNSKSLQRWAYINAKLSIFPSYKTLFVSATESIKPKIDLGLVEISDKSTELFANTPFKEEYSDELVHKLAHNWALEIYKNL